MTTTLILIAVVCVVNVAGQWPLPPSFYEGMNQMQNNLQTMSLNLQAMGQRMAARRDAIYAENVQLAQNGTDFGGNGKIFVAADGGLGYAYSSPDGSYTMYIIGSGNPPRGFMYHNGPNGNQYRSW